MHGWTAHLWTHFSYVRDMEWNGIASNSKLSKIGFGSLSLVLYGIDTKNENQSPLSKSISNI